MHVQTLESRTLRSVSAADIHDTLYVWGDAANNGLSVEKAGSDLVVRKYVGGGYAEFFRTPAAGIAQVRVYGYAGADTISIDDDVTVPATVFGGKGGDYIKGGGGMNDLWGHGNWDGDANHSVASDDAAADTIVSGKGYTVQHGQKGDDTLITDAGLPGGYDVMYGGDGNDEFHVRGKGDNAYAFGEAGDDTFLPTLSSTQTASFYGGAGQDAADYRDWNAAIAVKPNGGTPCGLRYGARHQILQDDVEIVYGTDKGDQFAGTDKRNVFFGRGGKDEMYGAGGDDQLYGDAGNDVLQGGDGNDLIVGGDGDDRLYGQAGNDQLNGNAGTDRLEGGDGNDSLWGQAGNDTLLGDAGNDTLHGGDGSDDVHGGSGSDALYGERDADWLYGDAGNDLLVGGHGSDFLVSKDYTAGNDFVFGDDQNGANAFGSFDIALVDVGGAQIDLFNGIESVSF